MQNTLITLSPQQQAVIDFCKDPAKGSLNLIAYAGTGKTSTLMEIAKVIKGSAFLGAFNKSIADEFKERLAAQKSFHVKGGTIHSAGYAAWGRVAKFGSPDGRKIQKLAKGKANWDRKLLGVICETVGYAKQQCLGVEGQAAYTDVTAWQAIIDYYDITDEIPRGIKPDVFMRMCQEVYKESLDLCETVCDFDDLLLAPLYFKAPFPKYDWVMIDEAQDTNVARRLICFAMMKSGSRLIAVGDPFQSIYGFAGANSDSMDLIRKELGSEELPLSVTYRCPKAVVKAAQEWVPNFTAHENAPNGLVTQMRHDALWKQRFLPNDVILCRNTRPLVGIAQRLRDDGIPCVVEGMSGKGLTALATKWGDSVAIDVFLDKLQVWVEQETAKWTLKDKAEKAEYAQEKAGTLRDLCRTLKVGKTTEDLCRKIDYLFGNQCDGNVLRLCTIHRSKGREWNRVYLVGRNRYMPSVWAKKDWEIQQEGNLAYVAVTRAKVELVEVDVPFKKKGDDYEWWERGWRACEDDPYESGMEEQWNGKNRN